MAFQSALGVGCFKTREDGSKVFFPWGPGAVGYLIPSEKRSERLQEQMSAWLAFGLPSAIFPFITFLTMAFDSHFGKLVVGALVMLAWIGAFSVWVRIQCGELVPTDEKLTVSEWAANGAPEASRFSFHLSVAISTGLFALSIYVVALRPENTVAMLFMDAYLVLDAVARARIFREKKRLASCPS